MELSPLVSLKYTSHQLAREKPLGSDHFESGGGEREKKGRDGSLITRESLGWQE